MQYTTLIDNVASTKWGLTLPEAYVFSWMAGVPLWADQVIIDNKVYYFASKNKAIDDIGSMITDKRDTMYRYYKKIETKGLIELIRINKKDYIAFKPKAAEWNNAKIQKLTRSDSYPSTGLPSETNSDTDPTNTSISSYTEKVNQKEKNEPSNGTVTKEEPEVKKVEPKPEITIFEMKREFEEFRLFYPNRKPGFDKAWEYFITKYPNEYIDILPKLKQGVLNEMRYAQGEIKKRGGDKKYFWKHWKTWMNNRCWEDEYPGINMLKVVTKNGTDRNVSSPLPFSEFEEVSPGLYQHPITQELRMKMTK